MNVGPEVPNRPTQNFLRENSSIEIQLPGELQIIFGLARFGKSRKFELRKKTLKKLFVAALVGNNRKTPKEGPSREEFKNKDCFVVSKKTERFIREQASRLKKAQIVVVSEKLKIKKRTKEERWTTHTQIAAAVCCTGVDHECAPRSSACWTSMRDGMRWCSNYAAILQWDCTVTCSDWQGYLILGA